MSNYNKYSVLLSNIKSKMSKLNGYEILYHKYNCNQYYYDIKAIIIELKNDIELLNKIAQNKYKFVLEYKRYNGYSDIVLWYTNKSKNNKSILYLYC